MCLNIWHGFLNGADMLWVSFATKARKGFAGEKEPPLWQSKQRTHKQVEAVEAGMIGLAGPLTGKYKNNIGVPPIDGNRRFSHCKSPKSAIEADRRVPSFPQLQSCPKLGAQLERGLALPKESLLAQIRMEHEHPFLFGRPQGFDSQTNCS